ncbi:MAG TPA: ADP-glyceromanno-heptose 6-epimerase [Capsulimonadaceae bacterium]|jgi:ADP-L-glycero-D-manno-heptose 6-epimerase
MIAVTGGAGFIGSVLVQSLLDCGDKVIVVDTLGSGPKFKNLRAKAFRDIVAPEEFLIGLGNGTYRPDAVVHLGARTDTSETDADMLLTKNTHYTRRLTRLCIEHGVRMVYASSASVYGDGELGFSDEDEVTPSLLPLNPYAFSKWLFDAEAIRAGWTDQIAGLRFFNVFGPNEYHKGRMASVVWHAFRQIQDTGKLSLFQSHRDDYAHGEQKRDFVYVDDVVRVINWFLDHPEANGIYNLGTGTARSFNDLAAAIFGALELPKRIDYIPTPENIRDSYQYFTEADLAKLRDCGCDVEFTSLEDAVADYVQGYLTKPNPYV